MLRRSRGKDYPPPYILCEKRDAVKKREEVESTGFLLCRGFLKNVMKKSILIR
jgi:hypothetical protein